MNRFATLLLLLLLPWGTRDSHRTPASEDTSEATPAPTCLDIEKLRASISGFIVEQTVGIKIPNIASDGFRKKVYTTLSTQSKLMELEDFFTQIIPDTVQHNCENLDSRPIKAGTNELLPFERWEITKSGRNFLEFEQFPYKISLVYDGGNQFILTNTIRMSHVTQCNLENVKNAPEFYEVEWIRRFSWYSTLEEAKDQIQDQHDPLPQFSNTQDEDCQKIIAVLQEAKILKLKPPFQFNLQYSKTLEASAPSESAPNAAAKARGIR